MVGVLWGWGTSKSVVDVSVGMERGSPEFGPETTGVEEVQRVQTGETRVTVESEPTTGKFTRGTELKRRD